MTQHRIRPGKTGKSRFGIALVVVPVVVWLVLCLNSDILLYGVIAAVPLVGVGTWLLIKGRQENAKAWQSFWSDSSTTKAVVVERYIHAVHEPEEPSTYSYHLVVGFFVPSNGSQKRVLLGATVSEDLYDATLCSNYTWTIRYANANPRIALLEGEWDAEEGSMEKEPLHIESRQTRSFAENLGVSLARLVIKVQSLLRKRRRR